MNKTITILMTLCIMATFPMIISADNTAEIGIGSGYGQVTIPIAVIDGSNVGSIDVTLSFDPTIATITDITNGDMDSMFSNVENIDDGYIRIGAYQTNNPGLDGTFIIADISFISVASSGSCPLGITVTTFKDSTPAGNPMLYSIVNGTYTATSSGGGRDGTYPPPSPTPTVIPTVTPTVTPTETPTTTPTPSPTKTLPDNGNGSPKGSWLIWVIAGILITILIVYIIYQQRD